MSKKKDYVKYSAEHASDLESRLKEADDDLSQTKKEDIASMKKYADMVISLEQRLSQAEADVEAKKQMAKCSWDNDWQQTEIRSLKARLSQAEAEKETLKKQSALLLAKTIVSEQRLSQAEADSKLLEERADERQEAVNTLSKRLSHLMDVAGKVRSSLEPWMIRLKGWRSHIEDGTITEPIPKDWLDVEFAIAEWDGIKKEGV